MTQRHIRCECELMKWICPLQGQTHTQEEALLLLAEMGNESARNRLVTHWGHKL